MASIEPLKQLDDDGLPAPEIGAWGEEKYRHVHLYALLFIRAMRNKWDALVYLDLFAGPGRSRIRGTKRIVSASPLLILGMPEAFDKYIFCEGVKNYAKALETRCRRDFPNRKVVIIPGDANASIKDMIAEMPRPVRIGRCWGFAFSIRFICRTYTFQQ
jgi:three-Cys-motif partner protein